jgi:hypothetical protein
MTSHAPEPPSALTPEEEAVAALLVDHFAHEDDACFACDLEGYVAERLDDAGRRAVDAHLVGCATCREALPVVAKLHGEGAFAMPPFDPAALRGDADTASADLPRPLRDRRPAAVARLAAGPRRPPAARWWGLLAAAAAIVATVAAFALSRAEEGEDPLVAKGPDTAVIGAARASDAIHLGVLRDGVTFRAASGDELRAGDLVRFFYSADTGGYVALFHLSADHEVATLYPTAGAASVPIAAGRELPLDGGATLDGADACEWVIGVFSDVPLDLAASRAALAATTAVDAERCVAAPFVPGARSVSVTAVRQ